MCMIEERMKEVLKNRNVNQKDAAKMLGITAGELSHWFVGRAKIKAEDVKKFCELFDTTPNYLMGFDDEISESDRALLQAFKTMATAQASNNQNKNIPEQTNNER